METLHCTKCKQIKPLGEFNFAKGREHRQGRFQWCKACVSIDHTAWRAKNQPYIKNYMQLRWRNNEGEVREKHYARCAEDRAEARRVIRERYGKVCACCGEATDAFLTLDHINGDGAEQRRKLKWQGKGVQFYFWLIRNGLPDGYRTLCFNCNAAAGTSGICPHTQTDVMAFVGVCG